MVSLNCKITMPESRSKNVILSNIGCVKSVPMVLAIIGSLISLSVATFPIVSAINPSPYEIRQS